MVKLAKQSGRRRYLAAILSPRRYRRHYITIVGYRLEKSSLSPTGISGFCPYPRRTTGENFRDKLDGNVLEAFLLPSSPSFPSSPSPLPPARSGRCGTPVLFPSNTEQRDFVISKKVYSYTSFFLASFQMPRYRYGEPGPKVRAVVAVAVEVVVVVEGFLDISWIPGVAARGVQPIS